MTARNHHYLPQCYLKNFAKHRGKPKLFVVDLKNKKTFETTTRNIAAEKDFHSIDAEGKPIDLVENAFSKFESDLSGALAQVIGDGVVGDGNTKILLLNLVTMIAIKNPRNRETFRQFQEDMSTKIMELVTSSDEIWNSRMRQAREAGVFKSGLEVSRDEMLSFLQRHEYTVLTPPGYHLKLELDLFDDLIPYFIARKWTLLRAPKGSLGFVTSDHPVSLFWSEHDPSVPRIYPSGYGMKKTDVLFPISSGLAWLGRFEHEEDVIDLAEEQVRHCNASVISMAERQVYGRDGDCRYQTHPSLRPRRLRELLTDARLGARKKASTPK